MGSVRKSTREKKINNGSLPQQKKAMLPILREHEDTRHLYEIVKKCSAKHRCNSKWCPTCSDPKLRPGNRKIRGKKILTRRECNLTRSKTGGKAHNYQVRAGQTMAHDFDGLPAILLHPITINLALVGLDENLGDIAKKCRKELNHTLRQFGEDSIVRGKLDFALKSVDSLNFEIPNVELPLELQECNMPHKRYAMLHAHFVLFHPSMSDSEVGDMLRAAYPGNKRVCVRKSYDDVVTECGAVVGGVQGYLEYASLEKIEINFGGESQEAVLEFARLDMTWTRANRNIRVGERTDQTLSSIDPFRVVELEARRVLQQTKKNWKNLDFAEQLIHRMFSPHPQAMAAIIDAVAEMKRRNNNRFRFIVMSSYMCVISNSSNPIWCAIPIFIESSGYRSCQTFGRFKSSLNWRVLTHVVVIGRRTGYFVDRRSIASLQKLLLRVSSRFLSLK